MIHFGTSLGDITWDEGRLSGDKNLIVEIKKDEEWRQKAGQWFGALPTGPGRSSNYLRSIHSAYYFLLTFFRENNIHISKMDYRPSRKQLPDGCVY